MDHNEEVFFTYACEGTGTSSLSIGVSAPLDPLGKLCKEGEILGKLVWSPPCDAKELIFGI
jgi:hypothetical protein